ncbi:hypothetical protein Tco_1317242 [Tanacetum coccineum]
MTKLSIGMEKTVHKSRPKSKNVKVRVNTNRISSQYGAGTEILLNANLNPSDGPGKAPFSISMKTGDEPNGRPQSSTTAHVLCN